MSFDYYDYRVKKYCEDLYKHIYLKRSFSYFTGTFDDKNTEISEDKLANNISRAKAKIFEYAMCNEFDYFVNLTLSKEKYDRYNLKLFIKDLAQFIRNYRTKHKANIQYLFIPERHKDGAWHMHGFIKGIPPDLLRLFTADEMLPEYILEKIRNNQIVCDWPEYSKKFGFTVIEPILSKERCAKYMTKYISKSMSNTIDELGAHLYYASKGLKIAELILKDYIYEPVDTNTMDFANEFIMTKFSNIPSFKEADVYDWVHEVILLEYLDHLESKKEPEPKPPVRLPEYEQLKIG